MHTTNLKQSRDVMFYPNLFLFRMKVYCLTLLLSLSIALPTANTWPTYKTKPLSKSNVGFASRGHTNANENLSLETNGLEATDGSKEKLVNTIPGQVASSTQSGEINNSLSQSSTSSASDLIMQKLDSLDARVLALSTLPPMQIDSAEVADLIGEFKALREGISGSGISRDLQADYLDIMAEQSEELHIILNKALTFQKSVSSIISKPEDDNDALDIQMPWESVVQKLE